MKFDLNAALLQWRRELRMHPGIEPSYQDELESNLLDRMEDLQREGLSEEAAFQQAAKRTLENVEELAEEYYKVRAVSNKKPRWKQKDDRLDFLPPHLFFTYFKQALRSIRASRSYFWINLLGLTLGLAATLILVKYVSYEWRTDRFHSHYDQIAIATIKDTPLSQPELFEPSVFSKLDYAAYPYVETKTQVKIYQAPLVVKQKNFHARIVVSDSNFFEVFDFALVDGPTDNLLKDPTCILLSSELAKKIFGNSNPLGEAIRFEGERYLVKGILDKPKHNSSLHFDAIVSTYPKRFWSKSGFECIVLSPEASLNEFNTQVADIVQEHSQFTESTLSYLPFSQLYYDKTINRKGNFSFGERTYEFVLGIIAVLILGISLFNFINLYAVTLLKRGKEFGVRKVMGAGRKELLLNFLFENAISSFLAVLASSLSIAVAQRQISQFVGKEIFLDTALDPLFFIGIWLLLLGVTTLYPVIRFPRIHPILAIKDKIQGRKSLWGRKILLTTQFVLTIGLIIVSLFFAKQLNFMLGKDLGFRSENIVSINFFPNSIPHWSYNSDMYGENEEEAKAAYEKLRDQRTSQMQYVSTELESNPYIDDITFRSSPLDHFEIAWKKTGPSYEYHTTHCLASTPNFLTLFDLELVEGRFFDPSIDASREDKVVINEAAKKFFHIDSLESAYMSNRSWGDDQEPFKVIGVVKDFAFQHLSLGVQPLVILYWNDQKHCLAHLAKGHELEALAFMENLYREVNPNQDFSYDFVDEDIHALYSSDRRVVSIYTVFTLIALLISALGLLGISSYDVQLRIKEIGIRKISGASIRQIMQLLTRDFFRYLLIAVLIACPVAALVVWKYLENFAHRTELSLWVFVVATVFTLGIALITMWSHTYRAARRNPVEALRYE